MASCAKIEGLMQARIDGELSSSEAVVFEQHLAECVACVRSFKRQQRASAIVFEALHEDRLDGSLRQSVLDNLPDLGPADSTDLATVNWRAKHPSSRWVRRLPALVAVFLAVLGVVIRFYWPAPIDARPDAIGVVTYQAGIAYGGHEALPGVREIATRAFVGAGDWFETASGGHLMLSMVGPTYIKLNEHSRVRIDSERSITIEAGEAWIDVARGGAQFEVRTASGHIAVLGTSFLVSVQDTETVVSVYEGEVHVDSVQAGSEFVVLRRGERARVAPGTSPTAPESVEVASLAPWTERISPDRKAEALFMTAMKPRTSAQELPSWKVHWVPTQRQDGQQWDVLGIRLIWQQVEPGPYCSYDIYVYDETMTPLFRDRLDSSAFTRTGDSYREIMVPKGPITGVNALIIRLTPDFSTGAVQTPLSVKALGL